MFFLVLGSYYRYLYLKSIYFLPGSTPKAGESCFFSKAVTPGVPDESLH